MGNIKGGKVGDVKTLRKQLKAKGGGNYLSRVPADSELTVRFLTEPDEWVHFYEHFTDEYKYFPCTDGGCPGCEEGEDPKERWLTAIVDVVNNSVAALVIPKSLAQSVMRFYEKYGTLLDRDYELSREGTGFDTEYTALPEAPSELNLDRFDTPDLWAALKRNLPNASDDDTEDEDEAPAKRPAKRTTAAKKPLGRKPLGRKPAAKDDIPF